MKFFYSKYFIYLVFIFSFLTMFIFISNVFRPSNNKFRNLLEAQDGIEDICKVNEDIYNYFYKTGEYKIVDGNFGKMDDASEIILNFLTEGFRFKYIFDYIWKTGKYVFFLILFIIIIIVTIYYSIASCVKCCNENCCDFFYCSCCKNTCFKKTICVFIPFIYLIIFVLVVFSVIFAVAAIGRFSGTICVAMQLADTFIEGEKRNVIPKWSGVTVVSDILKKLGNITSEDYTKTVNNINSNMENYFKKLKEWNEHLKNSHLKNTGKNFTVNSPKMYKTDIEKEVILSPVHSYKWGPHNKTGTVLFDIDDFDAENTKQINLVNYIFEKYLYSFLGCIREGNKMICKQSSFSEYLFSAANTITNIQEPISKIKTKIAEPVKNIYYKVNTTVIGIFVATIIFVIIYCILIEILLSIFCCSKNNKCLGSCLKWTLCFIYYTSIFIVIIGLAIGIAVGVISCVVKNATQVVGFITSHENFISDNPKIFGKNNYLQYLDVCLNENGELAAKLGLIESFENIDNITDISDETEKLINITNVTSPMIDYYLHYLNNLSDLYLEGQLYNVGEKNVTIFNITGRIKEINNYVSGEYSENKQDCLINETWATISTKKGYIYNNTYPYPTADSRYLIYLYDKGLYDKVKFDSRYNKACPTKDSPYENVSTASSKFSELFKKINESIAENFTKEYIDDLKELNKIFNDKNKYLIETLKNADIPIDNIVKSIIGYVSGKENVFSLLNCKFVGENKKILLDILYTSLGVYLDYFGLTTILFSLFLFIGIIFILIVIKNTDLEAKAGVNNQYSETLDNIWKGNDFNPQSLESDIPIYQLVDN